MLYKHQLSNFQDKLLCKVYNLAHLFPHSYSLQDLGLESNPSGENSTRNQNGFANQCRCSSGRQETYIQWIVTFFLKRANLSGARKKQLHIPVPRAALRLAGLGQSGWKKNWGTKEKRFLIQLDNDVKRHAIKKKNIPFIQNYHILIVCPQFLGSEVQNFGLVEQVGSEIRDNDTSHTAGKTCHQPTGRLSKMEIGLPALENRKVKLSGR